MNEPKDYDELDNQFPLDQEGDWRHPPCPRAAWFALGLLIGWLFTWGVMR